MANTRNNYIKTTGNNEQYEENKIIYRKYAVNIPEETIEEEKNIDEQTINATEDMNKYKREYYHTNKETIKRQIRRRTLLSRQSIKKEILDYEPNFNNYKVNSRRSMINQILICVYDIRLIYCDSSYNDFVNKFNEVCGDESLKVNQSLYVEEEFDTE